MSSINKITGLQGTFEQASFVKREAIFEQAAVQAPKKARSTLALFEAENASAVVPADVASNEQASKHYERAFAILQECDDEWCRDEFPAEKVQRALDEIQKAIDLNPNCAGFYLLRGSCFAALNRVERALNDFDKAIASNPEYTDKYFSNGKAYYLRGLTKMILTFQDMLGGSYEDLQKAFELGDSQAADWKEMYEAFPKMVLSHLLEGIEEADDQLGLLPPYAQENVERARLVEELERRNISYEDIYKTDDGFIVVTEDSSFEVTVKYLPSDPQIVGPAKFELQFPE